MKSRKMYSKCRSKHNSSRAPADKKKVPKEEKLSERDIKELMRHDSYTRNGRGAVISRANLPGKVIR